MKKFINFFLFINYKTANRVCSHKNLQNIICFVVIHALNTKQKGSLRVPQKNSLQHSFLALLFLLPVAL